MYIQKRKGREKFLLGGIPPNPPKKIRGNDLRKRKKEKKERTLVIRLTNSEYKRIKELAELEGITVSELVRKSVL